MDAENTQPDEHATAADGMWQQPESPTESVSLSDHEATFSREARENAEPDADAVPEGETAEQEAARLHHSAEQKREKETGKFTEGKAKGVVKRIDVLTGKLQAAEGALSRANAELAELKARGATRTETARAEQKVERAEAKVEASSFADPEPTEDDPKFGGDYGKYLRDVASWEGRKAYHDERQAERASADRSRREQADREVVKTWADRVKAAQTQYDDYDAVAFGPTRIPSGSTIDAFVMEDEDGPSVLYHLNQHPEEVDSLLQMSPLQQLKRLAKVAEELSPTLDPTETTGSVAERRIIVMPPKPPNPVRTEAQRAHDGPPSDRELSLSEHEKYFGRRTAR
ncbi:MAG: hypothetical protein M3Q55_13765 [Acidobacteriota bacterium]|nr:hypothetical protein [Acidobacteriota bacterium]